MIAVCKKSADLLIKVDQKSRSGLAPIKALESLVLLFSDGVNSPVVHIVSRPHFMIMYFVDLEDPLGYHTDHSGKQLSIYRLTRLEVLLTSRTGPGSKPDGSGQVDL